jgi:diguanylate cyclase (GGDEF)-like protein
VLSGDGPVLLPRSVRGAAERAQLRALGYREAIVVPLQDGTGVVGALAVGDRPGETTSFEASDVAVLQTFADQARLALQHGRLIERLEHETTHDGLTGLPNVSAFREATLQALAAMARGEGRGFALLLVHIDDFAEVNTSLGYQSGEQLLQQLAARLVAAVPPGAVPARVGDDEFGVLLPGANLPAMAVTVGKALRAKLSQALVVDGVDVRVVVSIGVATAPSHAHDVSGLLRAAGCALEDARATPSRVTAYDRDLTPSGQTQLAVLADLRRALERDEVAVYVQPQAHAATGEVLGVEALVRWVHPTLGLLTPDKFLPLAQRHGLMAELTYVVLRQATGAAADWRAAGLDLTMAVNLDPSTLAVEDLPERLDAILAGCGLPADRLTLEITEDSTIGDLEAALAMLRRLRRLGVGLSVDDYGTGYASLSYLRRLPATEVKIDRSFTQALATDEADLVIVRSIIDLAGNLCLRVVAEGVEDQMAWDRLSALGCDLIQGYHLARPMPLAELFGWVTRYHAGLGAAGPHRGRASVPPPRDGNRTPAFGHGGPTHSG